MTPPSYHSLIVPVFLETGIENEPREMQALLLLSGYAILPSDIQPHHRTVRQANNRVITQRA